MDKTELYVYVEPPKLALPISVVLIKLNKELPELPAEINYNCSYIQAKAHTESETLSVLSDFIEHLTDTETITYTHTFIYPSELNTYGVIPYLRDRVDKELSLFQWEHKIRQQDLICCRQDKFIRSNYYYNQLSNKNSIEFKLGFIIGWLRKRLRIERLWHPLHPEYNWLSNNGDFQWDHVSMCLTKGIEPQYHIYESLKIIPEFWYKEIIKGNLTEIYLRDYYIRPPEWWKKLIGKDFLCFLPENHIDKLMMCLRGKMPKDFIDNFLNVYPPLLEQDWDDYKAIFSHRYSYEFYKRKAIFGGKQYYRRRLNNSIFTAEQNR